MTRRLDDDVRDQAVEHECPTPLRARAEEFMPGGMVFTPAGRWETLVEVSTPVATVIVRTDRATWTWWPSDQMPYLPSWEVQADPPARVVVDETTSTMTVEVRRHLHGRGHSLLTAWRARGGWVIQDRPDGATSEQVTVGDRAKARTEIKRRARAHAKRLGLPVELGQPAGGAR